MEKTTWYKGGKRKRNEEESGQEDSPKKSRFGGVSAKGFGGTDANIQDKDKERRKNKENTKY